MDAAVLYEYGTPRFGTFDDPVVREGTEVVEVIAAAISRFDLSFASGQHYLKPSQLPSVAGREGVGRLADGRRVYFDAPVSPYGSMAQKTLVASQGLIDVPDDVDVEVAAALGNAGLAAWLPLEWRAQLVPGETVLVLGATGVVGQIAVQAAKILGAKRVIAAGRNEAMLQRVQKLGADAIINLETSDDLPTAYREAAQGDIHVILDYVWGPATEAALQAATAGGRLVQIGTVAGDAIPLSAAILRSKLLTVFGYANFHSPFERRSSAYRHMAQLAAQGQLIVPVERIPLRQVAQAWERQRFGTDHRLVVTP